MIRFVVSVSSIWTQGSDIICFVWVYHQYIQMVLLWFILLRVNININTKYITNINTWLSYDLLCCEYIININTWFSYDLVCCEYIININTWFPYDLICCKYIININTWFSYDLFCCEYIININIWFSYDLICCEYNISSLWMYMICLPTCRSVT